MTVNNPANTSDKVDQMIEELNEVEKLILQKIGRMKVSQNKNIAEETIYKKMPNEFHDQIQDCIRNLIHKGILQVYRPKNYCLSKEGLIASNKIYSSFQKEQYNELRILLFL